jgi:sodium/hydrogen antiporter
LDIVLAYAMTLQVAALLSGIAGRSVLSTAVLFLGAGFVFGGGWLGLIRLGPDDPLVSWLAELALFSVLFTDGMRAPLQDLRASWHLPGRALLFGLPLTMLFTALPAYFLVGLPWPEALLVGAALSPTDPVFAEAIVGRPEVPRRLRSLLNVESGLNDGLALPFVVVLLAVVGQSHADPISLGADLVFGVALGVALPWLINLLARQGSLDVAGRYKPLNAFATGMLVYAVASLTHANLFLAAFTSGITLASVSPQERESFRLLGESVSELLKLAAVLVFGALISPAFLHDVSYSGYLFAVLALVLVRPLALAVALFRSRLTRREWLAAAWFGPKGFASVVYGLLILRDGGADGQLLFHLIAIVIALSILAHSSTDVLVARWFQRGGARDHLQEPR